MEILGMYLFIASELIIFITLLFMCMGLMYMYLVIS